MDKNEIRLYQVERQSIENRCSQKNLKFSDEMEELLGDKHHVQPKFLMNGEGIMLSDKPKVRLSNTISKIAYYLYIRFIHIC
jgi:hypothetical protein